MGTPAFDWKQPYGDIYGDELGRRFMKNGHYFRADGSYHSTEGDKHARQAGREMAPPPPPPASVETVAGITEGELGALLTDERAAELLELPRDQLLALVAAANGPAYYGERSTELMVGWLLKNTRSGESTDPADQKATPPPASPSSAGAPVTLGDEDL